MMAKIKSSKTAALKLSMGILISAALLAIFACENKKPIQDNNATTKPSGTIVNDQQKTTEPKEPLIFRLPSSETIVNDQQKTTATEEADIFIIEPQASFQGGDVNSFRDWVTKSLKYPEMAAKKGISGKVYVQYSVNSKGEVVDVKVVCSADPLLDEEAVRVISSSPKWEPATQKGKRVKQQFTIPIAFSLK